VALGDASYSLYLTHLFLLPAVAKAWRLVGLEEILPADAYMFAVTVGSCIAAFCTYYVVERPLGLALSSRRPTRQASAATDVHDGSGTLDRI